MVIFLALVLALPVPRPAPAGPSSPLSDEQVREQLGAYLGSIDTPITAERWSALGPRGRALLSQLVKDPEALPTRRAKAVDGLSALHADPQLFSALAASETEPLVVRLSALRGLGQVVPLARLPERLRPLLEGARDSRVRAGAAEVLAAHQGCAQVRAQAAREAEGPRAQFVKALAACGEQ